MLNTLAPTALCRAVPIGVASASRTIRPRWPPWAANHAPSRDRIVTTPAIPTPTLITSSSSATDPGRSPSQRPGPEKGNPMLQWPRVRRTSSRLNGEKALRMSVVGESMSALRLGSHGR